MGDTTTELRVAADSAAPVEPFSAIQVVAIGYLGLAAVVPRWLELRVFGFGSSLLVALGLAASGWRQPMSLGLRHHFNRSVLFATWLLVSAVAAWSGSVLYLSATFAMWIAFLIPGLARIFRHPVHRRVLRWSLVAGGGLFVGVACLRVLAGHPALDAAVPGKAPAFLLGVNRNLVNIWVIVAMALVFAARPSRFGRVCQAAFVFGCITWIVASGGRTGFVGIFVVALILTNTNTDTKTDTNTSRTRPWRRVLQTIAAIFALLAIAQTTPLARIEGVKRFEILASSSRDSGDQIRVILTKKAWHLGWEHPLFGVGAGQFGSTYDRAVEQASTVHIKDTAATFESHNTYLELFATTGLVGLLLFLAVFLPPLLAKLRELQTREARAVAAAFAATLVGVAFHTALGTALFIPLALQLAAIDDPEA